MIIQKVIKGIGGITPETAQAILQNGIYCRWWQQVDPLPYDQVPRRLTERNLAWHQNRYDDPDPLENNTPFGILTPFISTTAGTVEPQAFYFTNRRCPAWLEALRFATNGWTQDGYLYYCYLFVLGKKAVGHEMFSEELRELNIYTGFSPFQPEGEITAKIVIPPGQIEKCELWRVDRIREQLRKKEIPTPDPDDVSYNPRYLPPDDYTNLRELL